jgi:hypothetical protein
MQILDPRIGNQRQKGLVQKVAQKAMARKGYASKVGTFGKLANAGKATRGLRPNRGPGQGLSRARPGGYQDFLDGLSGGPGQQQQGAGYVNTAPTHAALPDSYLNPMENTLNPQQSAQSDVGVPVGTPGETPGTFNAGTPQAPIYTDVGGALSNPNNPAKITASGSLFEGALPSYSQSGPSSPITAPGGLIPLGNGRYYDPHTDTIHGGGGTVL